MTVHELRTILAQCNGEEPITIVASYDGFLTGRAAIAELPIASDGAVTHEGGGASPAFYAINVIAEGIPL